MRRDVVRRNTPRVTTAAAVAAIASATTSAWDSLPVAIVTRHASTTAAAAIHTTTTIVVVGALLGLGPCFPPGFFGFPLVERGPTRHPKRVSALRSDPREKWQLESSLRGAPAARV